MKTRIITFALALAMMAVPAMAQKPVHHPQHHPDHGLYGGPHTSMFQSSRTYRAGMLVTPRFQAQPGFQQMADATFMFTDDAAVELSYTAGYRFNDWFFLGGGAGLGYSDYNEEAYIPVYVSPVFYFTDRRVAPMLALRLGATAVLGNDFKGEHYYPLVEARPGIAIHLNGGNDINVNLVFGSRPIFFIDHDIQTGAELGKVSGGSYVEGGLSVGFSF